MISLRFFHANLDVSDSVENFLDFLSDLPKFSSKFARKLLIYEDLNKTSLMNKITLEELYDYESMAKEISIEMMVLHRVKEPTLNKVLMTSEKFIEAHKPAWIESAEVHPGLPDHYFVANEQENDSVDSFNMKELPFDVNREIHMKLLVAPLKPGKHKKKLPSLKSLMNGTIVIVGDNLPVGSESNIEVFLSLHEKLLPCCLAQRSNVIFKNTSRYWRTLCYFIPDSTAQKEILFFSSQGQVLYQMNNFEVKWFHGSTPYKFLYL